MRFFTAFALTVPGLIAGWIALVLAAGGQPTVSSQPLCNLIAAKAAIAARAERPKLLIVSGSNAGMGVDALLLSELSGRPAVNFGTHAGLSLDYLLTLARRHAQPGDIVILPLEYEHYGRQGMSNAMLDYVLACDSDYLGGLPRGAQAEAMFAVPTLRLASGIAQRLELTALAERLAYLNLPLPAGARYDPAIALSPAGDSLRNRRTERSPEMLARLAEWPAISFPRQVDPEVREKLAAFAAWAKERQVAVVAAWPNTLFFPAYRGASAESFFAEVRKVYAELGIEMLGRPEESMFERAAFFDSNYHLHDEAAAERTRRLYAALKPMLQSCCPEPTLRVSLD
jgi:hypothetical protein